MADTDWQEDLDGWLEPSLAMLAHGKRRLWAPAYLARLVRTGEDLR